MEQIETCIETCNIMRKLLICCSPYTARGRQTGSPDPESKSVEVIEAHPGSAVEKAIENTDTLRRGVSGVICNAGVAAEVNEGNKLGDGAGKSPAPFLWFLMSQAR